MKIMFIYALTSSLLGLSLSNVLVDDLDVQLDGELARYVSSMRPLYPFILVGVVSIVSCRMSGL